MLVRPAGITVPRDRTPGRVGRGCLPRLAAGQGRGGACAGRGSGVVGKRHFFPVAGDKRLELRK